MHGTQWYFSGMSCLPSFYLDITDTKCLSLYNRGEWYYQSGMICLKMSRNWDSKVMMISFAFELDGAKHWQKQHCYSLSSFGNILCCDSAFEVCSLHNGTFCCPGEAFTYTASDMLSTVVRTEGRRFLRGPYRLCASFPVSSSSSYHLACKASQQLGSS